MFYLLKELNGANNVGSTMKIPVSAGTYDLCSVLKEDGAKATGNAVGAYIVMEGGANGKVIPTGGGDMLVTPINGDMIFESVLGKAGTENLAVGDKVSIHTDSLTVDPTVEGKLEVVEATTAYAKGTKVRVKFIKE